MPKTSTSKTQLQVYVLPGRVQGSHAGKTENISVTLCNTATLTGTWNYNEALTGTWNFNVSLTGRFS